MTTQAIINQANRDDKVTALTALSYEQRQSEINKNASDRQNERWHECTQLKAAAFAKLNKVQRTLLMAYREHPPDWIDALSNI